jgi:hypothetical protein
MYVYLNRLLQKRSNGDLPILHRALAVQEAGEIRIFAQLLEQSDGALGPGTVALHGVTQVRQDGVVEGSDRVQEIVLRVVGEADRVLVVLLE